MLRQAAFSLTFASAAVLAQTSAASACDVAPLRELAWDGSEKIPGWALWRFTSQAPVSGHTLYSRIEQASVPAGRATGSFIETRVRSAVAKFYKRDPTAIKLDFLQDKAFQLRKPGDYSAKGKVFVAIMGFGPDFVRASEYLRQNERAKNLTMVFALTMLTMPNGLCPSCNNSPAIPEMNAQLAIHREPMP